MANNPYTDPQRTAQRQAQQAQDIARQASQRGQQMHAQMSQQARDTAQKFAREASERQARDFEKLRTSRDPAGMPGVQVRAPVLFGGLLLFVLLPFIVLAAVLFICFKFLGG